ncbi:MAG: FkbM family methyltransferase [Pedosphaera sp.]|nr:FkbM family methyltransferase [Pedosphaera sp.]
MSDATLLQRFHACLHYKQAKPWQKPFLNPRRFARNQMRKRGLVAADPGALRAVPTFHLPEFTVVSGEFVSEEISSYGLFEPELTEAFLRLVKPGQVVVDIGMHLGYYATLFAVLVGAQGEVHAFEPTPSTREISRRNTSRFAHVTVHPFAVWSSVQTIAFQDFGLRWMAFNSLAQAKIAEAPVPAKQIDVQTITLDQFRHSLGKRVSFVKIDAESAEREILAGARELLGMDQPIVSVEVGDRGGARDSRSLVNDFRELDFAPWEFGSGRFSRHEPREIYDYDNLIFAPARSDLSSV